MRKVTGTITFPSGLPYISSNGKYTVERNQEWAWLDGSPWTWNITWGPGSFSM